MTSTNTEFRQNDEMANVDASVHVGTKLWEMINDGGLAFSCSSFVIPLSFVIRISSFQYVSIRG